MEIYVITYYGSSDSRVVSAHKTLEKAQQECRKQSPSLEQKNDWYFRSESGYAYEIMPLTLQE